MKHRSATIALLLSFAAVCMAQNDSVSSYTLQELRVEASRSETLLRSSTPRYRHDVDSLRLSGVTDVAGLLHHFPGIVLRDYGGAGGIKTISVRGLGSQHTTTVVDGVVASDNLSGQTDFSRYSLNLMQVVELSIGDTSNDMLPARAMASQSAIILNSYVPERQDTMMHTRASIEYGSWNHVSPSLRVSAKIAPNLFIAADADYLHADNNYSFELTNVSLKTIEHRTNSRVDEAHGALHLHWLPTQKRSLTAKVYGFDSDRLLPGPVHYYTNENDESLKTRNLLAQVSYADHLSNVLKMKASASWTWNEALYHNGIPSGGIKSESYWQREYYSTVALAYQPTRWFITNCTVDAIHASLNSTHLTADDPKRTTVLAALGAKIVTERLSLTTNAIFNNTDEERHVTPAASLSWKPWKREQLYVRASWKNTFRMPTFNELYYYHLGNQNLRPESSSMWNIGLTGAKNNAFIDVRMSVDAYLGSVKDKIVSVPFNTFVWRTMNIGSVRTMGIDFQGDCRWEYNRSGALSLMLNYSFQKVANNVEGGMYNGYQIAYTPMHSGTATLLWHSPWAVLSATATANSRRWTTNEHAPSTDLAPYAELSTSLSREFKVKKRSVIGCSLSVNNLLNTQYEIIARYPMPRRSFRLRLEYKF